MAKKEQSTAAILYSRNEPPPGPHRGRLILISSVIAIALTFGGCGKVEKRKKSNALEAAVTAHGSALRWAYYDTAWGYLHPDKRGTTMPDGLDNVRVTGYDIIQPPLRSSEDKASQVVRIEYLFRDHQSIHTLTDRQDWRFDPETETWWLHSDFPDFK